MEDCYLFCFEMKSKIVQVFQWLKRFRYIPLVHNSSNGDADIWRENDRVTEDGLQTEVDACEDTAKIQDFSTCRKYSFKVPRC